MHVIYKLLILQSCAFESTQLWAEKPFFTLTILVLKKQIYIGNLGLIYFSLAINMKLPIKSSKHSSIAEF